MQVTKLSYLVFIAFFYSASLCWISADKQAIKINIPNKNVTQVINTKDVISYISSTPHEAVEGGKGLKNCPNLERRVKQQAYVDVLAYLWSETNTDYKVTWLTKKANEGHIIFMFELAKELAKQNNTKEALKWFFIGLIRSRQDGRCCEDASVEDNAVYWLSSIYYPFIKKSLNITTEEQADKLITSEIFLNAEAEAIKYAKTTKKHVSPTWISYHGISAFLGNSKLKPQKEWATLREAVIKEYECSHNKRKIRSQLDEKKESSKKS